jgi:ParB-like nuclease domain
MSNSAKASRKAARPPGRAPRPHIEIPSDVLIPKTEASAELGVPMRKKAQGAKMGANRRPVHPIADLFPMMSDGELSDLAADIRVNGLLDPITVDKDGVIIDGRNRARACEIAGIEPATAPFEGDDPGAFIIAKNICRRHLTKGQQAMAVAMVYPVPEQGGRGKKKTMDETSTLFSPKRLQLARTVLAHSPDLAQAVLAGSKSSMVPATKSGRPSSRSTPRLRAKSDARSPAPKRLPCSPRTAPAIPKIILRQATELRRSNWGK